MTVSRKYNPTELEGFSEMFADVVAGMEENPDQDFLGELYMRLELGNDHAGQFFTPYDVCRCMSAITEPDIAAQVAQHVWISVNDPSCGAGATLIAFANDCLRQNVNYQTSVLFAAQDIDYTVGLMCYIQLSLLGCAGYVTIANTLTHPQTCLDRRGLIPRHGESIWYTPMYFCDIWQYRRIGAQMELLFQGTTVTEQKQVQQEPLPVFEETKAGQLRLF